MPVTKLQSDALKALASSRSPAVHERVLPLGAVVCAAVGRFPGQTPEEMLADIRRHSRFTADEFHALATESPLSIDDVSRRIRDMLEDADAFVQQTPTEVLGVLFLRDGVAVQPNLKELALYEVRSGLMSGIWPSSPEISRDMLWRYGERGQ